MIFSGSLSSKACLLVLNLTSLTFGVRFLKTQMWINERLRRIAEKTAKIPDTKRAVIPQNPADGRRLNVTVTGHFGAQTERARAGLAHRARWSARAPRPEDQRPNLTGARQQRCARGRRLKKERISFNNAGRTSETPGSSEVDDCYVKLSPEKHFF